VILILYNYGNGENGTNGARVGVSETRVEAINGDVCLVSRDAGIAERRLSRSMVSVSNYDTSVGFRL
jgi:hypothetical protein